MGKIIIHWISIGHGSCPTDQVGPSVMAMLRGQELSQRSTTWSPITRLNDDQRVRGLGYPLVMTNIAMENDRV